MAKPAYWWQVRFIVLSNPFHGGRLVRTAGNDAMCITLLALLAAACCQGQNGAAAMLPAQIAETESVRALMKAVAHDVTKDGPTAWLKYFDEGPAFFMAVNGAMAFPNGSIARDGTQKFAGTIQHIELNWGDDVRVDPLGKGLAVVGTTWREVQIDKAGHRAEESGYFTAVVERRNNRWMFRDAHWSSPVTPGGTQ